MALSTTDELKSALHELAQPAAVQFTLVPDWLLVGEELAKAFHGALSKHRASGAALTVHQARELAALEAYLIELSGPYDRALWCNPSSLVGDSRWGHIRAMARVALDALATTEPAGSRGSADD